MITNGQHCWEWTASLRKGSGRFKETQKDDKIASKFLWEKLYGPVPEGSRVQHLCRNRKCVNPNHLYLEDFLGRFWGKVEKSIEKIYKKRRPLVKIVGSGLVL